jgi:hypothetical protein
MYRHEEQICQRVHDAVSQRRDVDLRSAFVKAFLKARAGSWMARAVCASKATRRLRSVRARFAPRSTT